MNHRLTVSLPIHFFFEHLQSFCVSMFILVESVILFGQLSIKMIIKLCYLHWHCKTRLLRMCVLEGAICSPSLLSSCESQFPLTDDSRR